MAKLHTWFNQLNKKQYFLLYIALFLILVVLGLFIGYGISSEHLFLNILNPLKWKHIFDFIFV